MTSKRGDKGRRERHPSIEKNIGYAEFRHQVGKPGDLRQKEKTSLSFCESAGGRGEFRNCAALARKSPPIFYPHKKGGPAACHAQSSTEEADPS